MRVFIYTLGFNSVSGGGSHNVLHLFVRALCDGGHTPILTTFFSDNNAYREKPCEMREEQFEGRFIALQRHCASRMRAEEKNADIFLIYGSSLMWGGGMYASEGGKVPVVASIYNYTTGMGLHRTPPEIGGTLSRFFASIRHTVHRAKWYAWEKMIGIGYVAAIDKVFFDSPVVLEQYRKFGYRFREATIIPAPVEKSEASFDLPSPYPTDPKIFDVLFAGRLIADKGPDLLVKAAALLPGNIHIHLVGAGNEETALRTFIKDGHLEERVHLHGWKTREELPTFYQHAHLFVHPVRWPEPFGLTAIMALGFGLPVITMEGTDAAGDAGVTFKKDDVTDLSKCILFFYNNSEERAAYAKRALVRAKLFDADIVSRQFVTNLESISAK